MAYRSMSKKKRTKPLPPAVYYGVDKGQFIRISANELKRILVSVGYKG